MKEIIEESFNNYLIHMTTVVKNYMKDAGYKRRRDQFIDFVNVFDSIEFPFDKLVTVETGVSQNYDDGLAGLLFGFATEKTNGKMFSVDIDSNRLQKSSKIFSEVIPNLEYHIIQEDSVKFLSNLSVIPNLVHLDSWDLDLKNPFPSALHGWKEFMIIEPKMPSGSIILIDDNFLKGTRVQWNYSNGHSENIDITYPIIGKGAHVYQHVLSGDSDWKLIGDHYKAGPNIKIMIQKK